MDEYISREAVVDAGYLSDWYISSVGNESPVWTDEHIDELLNDFLVIPKDTPSADVQPVKQWYSVEENQPDSVGDDVLVVDSYGKYHIAYYLSGSENWMNQDTREPIKDVVKWRYLDGRSE